MKEWEVKRGREEDLRRGNGGDQGRASRERLGRRGSGSDVKG